MALTSAGKWDCPACTYLNWSSSLKCALCGNPKPVDTVIPKSTIAKLKLQTQTTLSSNKAAANISASSIASPTELNSSPHPKSPNLTSNLTKWNCSICTYQNWPNANICTLCRSARNNDAGRHVTRDSSQSDSCYRSILEYASTGQELSISHSAPKGKPHRHKGNSHSHNDNRTKKWRCSKCTYENLSRNNKCAMCYTGKNRTPSPPLHTEGQLSAGATDKSNWWKTDNEEIFSRQPISTSSYSSSSTSNSQTVTYSFPSPSLPSPKFGSTCSSTQSKSTSDKVRQIRNQLSSSDWLFLNACQGVVNGDQEPVKAYLKHNGDKGRQLTNDEVLVLKEKSKFTIGSTLVHLAIRFQKTSMFNLLLTPAPAEARKRLPSQSNPELATKIREQAALCLKQHKGDWPCYFFTQLTTFILPADIRIFCEAVQNKVLDDVIDREVQKVLEELEPPVINWSSELTEDLHSRLFPLWNRTAGDCLLDSSLQASWGVVDRDSTLRRALADSLVDGSSRFYSRWKEAELALAHAQGFSLDEEQLKTDWSAILALADQKGKSLEQAHIFTLAHILKRPVVVYGVKMVKNYRGENLGFVNFEGIYLPLLWESSFCWRSPIALAYTRGHFSALVSIAHRDYSTKCVSTDDWSNKMSQDNHVTYLPLVNADGKLLPLHFLSELEIGYEEKLLNEYCECHLTQGGVLTAKQDTHPQHQTPLMAQLMDMWLDKFRRIDKRHGKSVSAACSSDYDS